MPVMESTWDLDVDRGPDCLMIRVSAPDLASMECSPLAEQIWSLMERHLVYRLVLELDEVDVLYSYLIGQLILLHRRIAEHEGTIRLCGLSPYNREVLHVHGLEGRLPAYGDRTDAVLGGYRPGLPR